MGRCMRCIVVALLVLALACVAARANDNSSSSNADQHDTLRKFVERYVLALVPSTPCSSYLYALLTQAHTASIWARTMLAYVAAHFVSCLPQPASGGPEPKGDQATGSYPFSLHVLMAFAVGNG